MSTEADHSQLQDTTGQVLTCEVCDQTTVAAGFDVLMLLNGEPHFSRRCMDKGMALSVAEALAPGQRSRRLDRRGHEMTDDDLRLMRIFTEQVERVLDTSAQFFDLAESGTLPAADAKHAAASRREVAAQARMMRGLLPPSEPYVM